MGLEHIWNLTSLVSPGTNSPRVPRDDCNHLPLSVDVNCEYDRCHSYDKLRYMADVKEFGRYMVNRLILI